MKLTEVLNERKISKLQLSMRAGISPSSLYDALNGRIPFYPAWKKRIAEYLQMDEQELFDAELQNNNEQHT